MIRTSGLPTVLRKRQIEEKLARICEEHDVVFLAIFGSFVRGEQKRGSDLDIAMKYAEGVRKSLFDLVELKERLEALFNRKVDIGEFDVINPYIVGDIEREMKVIYEKG